MNRARPLWRSCSGPLLALAGGVLVAAALPPLGWWPLAPLGCGLLATGLEHRGFAARMLRGWCFGLGQFGVGLLFIMQFSGVGYVLLIAVEALFPALAAAARGRRAPLLSLAGALAIAEWCREHFPFGGLPPGGLPLSAAGSPYAGLMRVGGPALVSAAVVASGAAAVALFQRLLQRRAIGREPLLIAFAVLALLGGAWVSPSGYGLGRSLRAVAVQGGGPRGLTTISQSSFEAFVRTLSESGEITPPVQLVLWPEDTVPLTGGPPDRSALGKTVGALARSLDATVLAGVTEPVGSSRFLNEEVAFSPAGVETGAIEKVHAVPFGEYVPLRGLLRHLVSLAAVPRDAVIGHNDGVLATKGAPVGVVISFETFFPDRGAQEVRAGAVALVAPTNTASYVSRQVPAQELAATRLLAIATGRAVLQAATDGYSALVLASGAVRAVTALGLPALLTARLPLRAGMTLYDRFGELPALVLAAGALLASWRRRPRRRQGSGCERLDAGGDVA